MSNEEPRDFLEEKWDLVWFYCPGCDEEYNLPEDIEECPICGEEGINAIT